MAGRIWLKIGWKVMVAWGILNIFFSILVPITSHLFYPSMGFSFGMEDEQFTKMSWQQLVTLNRDLGLWVLLMMDTMCAMMMGFGILTVWVAWAAYRRGERWAWRALVVSNLLSLPYFAGITALYASRGLYLGGLYSGVSVGVPLLLVWLGVLIVSLWLPRRELIQP